MVSTSRREEINEAIKEAMNESMNGRITEVITKARGEAWRDAIRTVIENAVQEASPEIETEARDEALRDAISTALENAVQEAWPEIERAGRAAMNETGDKLLQAQKEALKEAEPRIKEALKKNDSLFRERLKETFKETLKKTLKNSRASRLKTNVQLPACRGDARGRARRYPDPDAARPHLETERTDPLVRGRARPQTAARCSGITAAAVGRMREKTPRGRGDRLIDTLLAWPDAGRCGSRAPDRDGPPPRRGLPRCEHPPGLCRGGPPPRRLARR